MSMTYFLASLLLSFPFLSSPLLSSEHTYLNHSLHRGTTFVRVVQPAVFVFILNTSNDVSCPLIVRPSSYPLVSCRLLRPRDYSKGTNAATPRGVWLRLVKDAAGISDVKDAILMLEETLRGLQEGEDKMEGGRMGKRRCCCCCICCSHSD